jgi:hypothetical protein
MDTIQQIHNLLINSCKRAYKEGRMHQRNSAIPEIKEAFELTGKKMPNCFEDTKIHAVIMSEYIESKS